MTEDKKLCKLSRRSFLGVSSQAAAGAIAGAAIIAGAGGYFTGQALTPPREVVREVATTTTATITEEVVKERKVKAGFVYVGPVGDYGWTYSHDQGRLYAEQKLPWLETIKVESVPEAQAAGAIDTLISQNANIVFTTSFGFMDPTIEASKKYSDVIFEHCSGYKRTSNSGTYFAEFYQLYYLCGLAAGAVTETGKVGYVAAHPIPEVIRHINAFVIGAQEAVKMRGMTLKPVKVVWLFEWFNPAKTKDAATSLIDDGADVLAFTEDSPTTLQVAQDYWAKGKKAYSFSHYGDMTKYGPDAHLTGQVVKWGPMYVDILSKVYAGAWESIDLWARIGDYMPYKWPLPADQSTAGKVEGAVHLAPLNPVIPEEFRALIKKRYEEMKELIFEPFTGPMKDQDGRLKLEEGQRADHDNLWAMDWFVEGIESKIPA